MALLQIPLITTNSVSWDLNETTRTHAHAHTSKHANAYTCWSRHGKHLRPRERNKKQRKPTDIKEMCLKLDTASFFLCTVAYVARMCTSTLSGWKQHPLQSLCICSLHLKDTESVFSNQNPNWGMQRAPQRWRDGRIPHVLLRITEGRVQLSWLVTPLSVSGLWRKTLQNIDRKSVV